MNFCYKIQKEISRLLVYTKEKIYIKKIIKKYTLYTYYRFHNDEPKKSFKKNIF